MTERRRFNGSERVALFLAAAGKCSLCGIDLERSWHADHMHPYSKDGATDVVNGQALCATCNLTKGDRTVEPLGTGWCLPLPASTYQETEA